MTGDTYEPSFWERQRGETAAQFDAFAAFRDAGRLRQRKDIADRTGRSIAVIHKWSAQNEWTARADAYDRHLDERLQEERFVAAVEAEKRHRTIARGMLAKAAQAIATMEPKDIPKGSLAGMIKAAVEIERLSLGLETSRTDNQHRLGEETDRDAFLDALQKPELREQVLDLADRATLLAGEPGESGK